MYVTVGFNNISSLGSIINKTVSFEISLQLIVFIILIICNSLIIECILRVLLMNQLNLDIIR
jgi:hypothetical protein